MRISRSRLIRIVLTLFVLGAAIVVLLPRSVFEVRSNGTINARLTTISAPISGVIVRDLPDVGSTVEKSQIVTRIVDDTRSETGITSLNVERSLLVTRVKALTEKIQDVLELRQRLEKRVEEYGKEAVNNIRLRRKEVEARFKSWKAVARQRRLMLDRQQNLMKTGTTTRVKLEEAEALHKQANEEVARAEADIERLQQEQSSASRGVFVNEGQNDVPYSQQRLDEVVMSLSELKVQKAEAQGRLDAINEQLGQAVTRASRREQADVRSPVSGVVWRRFFTANAAITKNNDLLKVLECSTAVVEVAVPESTAETLSVGTKVTVRLQGTERRFAAHVSEIRGTRSVTPGLEFAAAPPLLKKDEELLVAVIDGEVPEDATHRFCNVGRRVEVTIGGGAGFLSRF